MARQTTTQSSAMLARVATRMRLAAWGRRFYLFLLIASGLYAVVLLIARFTGVPANLQFAPLSLLVIPFVALVISLFWHPKPGVVDAARVVDRTSGSKDLFLTYATLEHSAGEYQPLVQADADRKADRVDPEKIVAWDWASPAGRCATIAAALWLGVSYLPQFDPFGKVAEATEAKQKMAQLEKDRKTTQLRAAELKEQGEVSKETAEAQKAMEELQKSLQTMKRDQPESNRDELGKHQKEIGTKWRELGAEKLRTLLSQDSLMQDFGGRRQEKLKKWTEELLQGNSESLNQEFEKMINETQAMLEETDPIKRSEMIKDMKQQLRDFEQFAEENAGSPELAAALRRAMRQLEQAEQSGDPQGAKEALEALAESLDLSKMELKQLAQAAKDMKGMEKALEVMQMAKSLNEKGELDGDGTGEFQSLADYAEFYAKQMGQDGQGEGMGGRGFGRGGEAPEDDSVASDFKTEQEKVATKAGKMLMSLKVQGLGEAGEANKEFRQLVSDVKQGVSEAIEQEQVPPGYHEGIRGYFDSINTEQAADVKP